AETASNTDAWTPFENFLEHTGNDITVDLQRLFAERPALAAKLFLQVINASQNGSCRPVRLQLSSVKSRPTVVGATEWLSNTDRSQRNQRLVELIQTEIGRVLRVPSENIDPAAPFIAMGMDSLMAVELRSRMQAALGRSIPSTLFFTNPNVTSLAPRL